MKRIIALTLMIVTITVQWQGCTKPEETGTIYGTVTDFATGEPIKNANVKLRPSGETTLTGSDGTYMFQNLKPGEYSLSLSKAGYKDLDDDYVIKLEVGKSICRDVQLRQKSAIRITDNNGNDISVLDFGDEVGDVSRIINLVNESTYSLTWQISKDANWIVEVSEVQGTLSAGETKGIIIKINRDQLQQGTNTTTLHITTNYGNQQLTVTATRADVVTLEASNVSGNSAILHGRINTNTCSEKGFYYGTDHNLNEHKIVPGNSSGAYSAQITGLNAGTTYYFKAYCVCNGTYFYGEEKQFQYIPSFEYEGHTYWVAPDPGYNISYNDAVAYCSGLTLHGCSDWQMPDKGQMLIMYANKESIGGWATGSSNGKDYYYWTSTSTTFGNEVAHYLIGITNGDAICLSATTSTSYVAGYFRVRPIRKAN